MTRLGWIVASDVSPPGVPQCTFVSNLDQGLPVHEVLVAAGNTMMGLVFHVSDFVSYINVAVIGGRGKRLRIFIMNAMILKAVDCARDVERHTGNT